MHVQLAPLEAGPTTGKQEARWGASYPTQLRILFIRMLKTRRFEALGKQDIIQFLVVGILSGEACCCSCTHACLLTCMQHTCA